MSRRAFARTWAAREGYAVYPERLPSPVIESHRGAFTIRPMVVIPVPGRVYSWRSVRLG